MCYTVQVVKNKTVTRFLMAPKNVDLDRLIEEEIYLIVFLKSNSASPVPLCEVQHFPSAFLLTVLSPI